MNKDLFCLIASTWTRSQRSQHRQTLEALLATKIPPTFGPSAQPGLHLNDEEYERPEPRHIHHESQAFNEESVQFPSGPPELDKDDASQVPLFVPSENGEVSQYSAPVPIEQGSRETE